MLLLTKPVSETPTHILLPVIRQTAHRILDSLSCSELIGNDIYIQTDFTTHSKTSDNDGNAIINAQAFTIEAHIQTNPTAQKFDVYNFRHTAAYGVNNRMLGADFPIYLDRENRVRILEVCAPVTIVLNCTLTLLSAELAYQTPLQIFQSHETGSVYTLNDLFYDYPIPKHILSVLYGIWKMDRIKGRPANVTFANYLKRHTDGRWQITTNRDIPSEYEIVLPCYDLQSIATLEYSDDKPQGEIEGRTAVGFSIPFIYTLQFEMPSLNILHYPPIINNRLLPSNYLPSKTSMRKNNIPEYRSTRALDAYDKSWNTGPLGYMQMPEYDTWVTPHDSPVRSYAQLPILIAAVLVDENETLDTLIDFSQEIDPSFTLANIVKEILYQQGEASVEYDAIYTIQLYYNDRMLLPYEDYKFNEDLQLTFKASNLQAHYHAVISLATDLSLINPKWWELIKKYYPWLSGGIKDQVKNAVENGAWRDPNLNKPILRDDGWVVDNDIPIYKLEDSKYPKGDSYGPCTENRITRYSIIARTAQEFKA